MKKLLTGVSDNIVKNIDKIMLWKTSFESVVDNGDVVLIAFNPTDADKLTLHTNEIKFHAVSEDSTETVNNSRIGHVIHFLDNNASAYDQVMYTDVFDVVFVNDPFQKMDFKKYDVFIAGEGVAQNQEPWNSDVMNKCFPDYYERMSTQEVFCSGVIGGTPKGIANMLLEMVGRMLMSKKGHDIEDQAAMNIVAFENNPFLFKMKKFNLTDNWCIHLATGGPTQFFEQWNFKGAIKDRYGITPDWTNYDIVHQFNRIPEIHETIAKRYE